MLNLYKEKYKKQRIKSLCDNKMVIDADYRGEIFVALHNDTDKNQYVTPGERIAQLIMIPFGNIEWQVTEDLSSTKRGAGGFGSTGKQ